MKYSKLKSARAVVAGFLMILILSVATDILLKFAGILPWDHLYVSTGLIWVVIAYRSVFSVAGCYLAARLAPGSPMKHALALGILGLIISSAGAVLAADLGPGWFAWTLAALSLPLAWIGGKLYEIRNGRYHEQESAFYST